MISPLPDLSNGHPPPFSGFPISMKMVTTIITMPTSLLIA